MHERSETEQRNGKWVNVYGRGTAFPGRVLPPKHGFEKLSYDTSQEAVRAATQRSRNEPDEGDPKDSTWPFEYPRQKFAAGGLVKEIPQSISDAEQVQGSVFDTWKDAGIRTTAGDPMGGFGMVTGGGKTPKMNPQILSGLLQSAKQGSTDAFEALYNQFKPLLKKLTPRGAPTGDMESEGFLALHRAVTSYDPTRGEFMNHLAPIAKHDIGRAASRQSGAAVDLPFNLIEDQRKLSRATQNRLVRPNQVDPTVVGQRPTPEALASRTGMPLERVRQVQNAPTPMGFAPQEGQALSDIMDAMVMRNRGTAGAFAPGTQAEQYAERAAQAKPTGARIYKKGKGPGTPRSPVK